MSRPLRIEYEAVWYHVINCGAGRRDIFSNISYLGISNVRKLKLLN